MLIESFLDYLRYERNYSDKTVLAYGEDIRLLQEFAQEEYGEFDPLEVEGELIREWIVSLMDKGYTSTSVNRKLSTLRTFYKFLLNFFSAFSMFSPSFTGTTIILLLLICYD